MRKIAVASIVYLALIASAYAEQWTILTQVCWRIQPIGDQRGQCAIGLQGTFRSRDECIYSNGGLLQADTRGRQGELIGRRCELLLPR